MEAMTREINRKCQQNHRIDGNSRIKLFHLVIQPINENDYNVIKVGDGESLPSIATRKTGIEVINLLKKGYTIQEVKESLSRQYHCGVDGIKIEPLIATLLKAKMIKSINGNSVVEAGPTNLIRYFYNLCRLHMTLTVNSLKVIALTYLPTRIVYSVIFALTFLVRKKNETNKTREIAQRNLRYVFSSNLDNKEIDQLVNDYCHRKIKTVIDVKLLSDCPYVLPASRLIKYYTSVKLPLKNCYGLEHLDSALSQKKGVILCAFHFGFVFLIPLFLCSLGYNIHSLALTGRALAANYHEQLNKLLKEAGFGDFRMLNALDLKSLALAIKVLEKQEIVCITPDGFVRAFARNPSFTKYVGKVYQSAETKVNLLGRVVSASTGTAWLHLQTLAPIVPVTIFRTKRNAHQLIIKPALQLNGARQEKTVIEQLTQTLYKACEAEIMTNPTHWIYWDRLHEM